jgi:hypothetical protein
MDAREARQRPRQLLTSVHVHNDQRFSRSVAGRVIPFLVAAREG